jgi:hypothetical protein
MGSREIRLFEPFLTKLDAPRCVHIQETDGRLTDAVQTDDFTTLKGEMISPNLLPRIE